MIARLAFIFIIFCILSCYVTLPLADGNAVTLKKPPETLKNWYKPINKRQVWLHNMFRLRRELLAINDYSQSQQEKLLKQWFKEFKKDYLEIGKMIPEWEKFLDISKLEKLQTAVEKNDYTAIPKLLVVLQNNCENCHSDYQAVSRLIYRGADFSKHKVVDLNTGHRIHYDKAMNGLSNAVNRIKIALHDHFYPQAIEFIKPLESQLENIAATCSDCHKQSDEQRNYVFSASSTTLEELKQALKKKDNKQARISLGTFAVKVCARCHSLHRTTAEIKELLE
jgi:hypothetical protein